VFFSTKNLKLLVILAYTTNIQIRFAFKVIFFE